MSEGCPGCFTSPQGQQQEYNRVKLLAQLYATQNNVSVAIYTEGFETYYMQASQAINEGKVIKEILSP